jgi:hypothetical protein
VVGRQALGPVVVLVDDDRKAVVGDLDLLELDPFLLADLLFLGLDRARGVGDVGLAGAELLEAAAGAGSADGHPHVAVLALELRRRGLRERSHRARAVDLDGAR